MGADDLGREEQGRVVASVSLPEYTVEREPDYAGIGADVDAYVEAHFPDGDYVARAIGLDDHPTLDLEGLAAIIEESGTDMYSSERASVAEEDFADYDFDFHGGRFVIRDGRIVPSPDDALPSFFGDIAYHFYEHAPLDRGYPVRIDLLLIYDESKLTAGTKKAPDLPGVEWRFERHLYRFADPDRRAEALVGLVKILR